MTTLFDHNCWQLTTFVTTLSLIKWQFDNFRGSFLYLGVFTPGERNLYEMTTFGIWVLGKVVTNSTKVVTKGCQFQNGKVVKKAVNWPLCLTSGQKPHVWETVCYGKVLLIGGDRITHVPEPSTIAAAAFTSRSCTPRKENLPFGRGAPPHLTSNKSTCKVGGADRGSGKRV